MCKLFSMYEKEIEDYCKANNLSFEKAKKFPKSWGKNDIWLQYHDPNKGVGGLRNETPALIVLKIVVGDDALRFEQTEYTHKYLSQ